MKNFAFNCDLIVQEEIQKIITTFNIKYVIETGTNVGYTTEFFSVNGCDVSSIEINKKFYDIAKESLKEFSNIHLYLGDSKDVLPQILQSLPNELTLVYLDAHWEKEWPLLSEIEIIGKYRYNNCIIVMILCY